MKVLPITTETFFNKSIKVAECYGFSNIDDLRREATKKGTNILGLQKHRSPDARFEQHVLTEVLRQYTDTFGKKTKQPLMFYTPSTVSHPATPSVRINALTLNTVGTNDPLAEVVLLKSATSILRELGIKKHCLRINSIGDNDSTARFLREATPHLKNRAHELSDELAILAKTNPGSALARLFGENHPIAESLPSPIEFLTTPSRKYFKEVLELLGNADIPFELADRLYADPNVYSHTIFEIVERQAEEMEGAPVIVLARGGRYDQLTRPYTRGSFPSTAIVIAMKAKDRRSSVGRPRKRKPSACIVHIGKEARLKSIDLIESFRERKIPVEQCLYFERFSDQMEFAKAQNTKYILIIGQQEARDNVVLMRDTDTHSQRTVPIESLADELKSK